MSLKTRDEAKDYAETHHFCPRNSLTRKSVEALEVDKDVCESPELTQKLTHESHIPTRMGREKKSTVELDYQHVGQLLNTFDCGEPLINVENEADKTRVRNEIIETAARKDDDSWSDLTDGSSDAEFKFRKKRNELKAQILKTNENIWRSYIDENYIHNKLETGRFINY